MVKVIDLVFLRGTLFSVVCYTSTREKFIGKLDLSDLVIQMDPFSVSEENPIAREARHAMAPQESLRLK